MIACFLKRVQFNMKIEPQIYKLIMYHLFIIDKSHLLLESWLFYENPE